MRLITVARYSLQYSSPFGVSLLLDLIIFIIPYLHCVSIFILEKLCRKISVLSDISIIN